MLNLVRFLRILTLVFVGVFGTFHIAPAVACTADEITLTDGTCVETKFSMDIVPNKNNVDFGFYMAAKGTFYIDWGDGDVETKTFDTAAQTTVTHNYKKVPSATIRIGGIAEEYNSSTSATLRFYGRNTDTPKTITRISGSLGALFPTLTNVASPGNQPLFQETFKNCTNLKGPIPAELFDGITGTARSNMFREMFAGCTQLDGYIPYNLFDGITGISSSNMNYIFNNTPALATTSTGCPNRTTQVTTGYESF